MKKVNLFIKEGLKLKILLMPFFLALVFCSIWFFANNSTDFQTSSLNLPITVTDKNFACNPVSKWNDAVWCKAYGGTFEAHKAEAARHQGVVVMYRVENGRNSYFTTNPDSEKISDKKSGLYSNSIVHCSQGAIVNYHPSAHIKFSPSRRGLYDGDQHYWCELNGVAVNPLSGK